MFKKSILAAVLLATAACQSTNANYTVTDRADDALGLTVLANMMVMAGSGGFAFFPLLIAADLHATNDAMLDAKSPATLQDTYKFVYKRDLNSVGSHGNTGMLFRDLKSATRHFHTVLNGHGVGFSDDFVLTAVRSADTRGYTLYALVHRPQKSISVRTSQGVRTITAKDKEFYKPYRTDAFGNMVDVVVDWAGVPRTDISTQKGQAILLTLGANSVLMNRRSDEFWQMEQRWINGQYRQVVAQRQQEIDRRMAGN